MVDVPTSGFIGQDTRKITKRIIPNPIEFTEFTEHFTNLTNFDCSELLPAMKVDSQNASDPVCHRPATILRVHFQSWVFKNDFIPSPGSDCATILNFRYRIEI